MCVCAFVCDWSSSSYFLLPPPVSKFQLLGIYAAAHDIHTQIPIDKPRRRRLKNSMFLHVYRLYRTISYDMYENEYKIPKWIRLANVSNFFRPDC